MNINLLSSVILTNEGIIALITSYNLSLTAYKLVHFTVKWNSSSTSARHREHNLFSKGVLLWRFCSILRLSVLAYFLFAWPLFGRSNNIPWEFESGFQIWIWSQPFPDQWKTFPLLYPSNHRPFLYRCSFIKRKWSIFSIFLKHFYTPLAFFSSTAKPGRTFRIIRTRVSIEMLQYDWLSNGHMIIKEMFYIPIKLKPELARASMTTSDVNNQRRSNFQQQII